MALIGKIRSYSVIVLVAIGLAMFGFLISDAFQHGMPLFNGQNGVGQISGQTIDPKIYSAQLEIAQGNQRNQLQPGQSITQEQEAQLQDQVWANLVDEKVSGAEWDKLGLTVTGEEIKDLVLGDYVHPIAQQYLITDRATGKYDKGQLNNFLKNLDIKASPEQKLFWSQFETLLVKERTREKYNSLVKNSMFVTDLEAKDVFFQNNKVSSIKYIGVPVTSVPDKDVEITDKDYTDYISSRPLEFKREASRSIEFVAFNIITTPTDSAKIMEYMATQKELFANSKNDSGFVSRRGKSSNGYVPKGLFPDVPANMIDEVWSADSGKVFGPFLDNGNYKLIKVAGVKTDTTVVYKASHILLRPAGISKEDTLKTVAEAERYIKSIKSGKDKFEDLARDKSQDPGSAQKGGDLGWFPTGQMVKPFAEAVKRAKVGEIVIAKSQFGVHIIKVTEPKSNRSVRLAILERKIEPSSETEKSMYALASKFRSEITTGDDFDKVIKTEGLVKRQANFIKPNDKSIVGLESARELVRWANEKNTKIGDVTSPLSIGNRWVVAKLIKMQEEGLASVEDVKDQIKPLITAEKKKAILLKKVEEAYAKSPKNLDNIAKELKQSVLTAENVSMNNPTLPNFGNELMACGYAAGLKPNAIGKPFKGNEGVFIIQVVSQSSPNAPASFSNERVSMQSMESQRSSTAAYDVLKEKADIKDTRYKFY
jgi:peptidyl-prolyl cis-trans isomerase D